MLATEAVRFALVGLRVGVTYQFVTGRGWSLPPVTWLKVVGGAIGVGILVRAADEFDEEFVSRTEIELRRGYATLLLRLGDDEAAERQYRRALELDSDCVPALEEYASFLEARGRTEAAERHFERAAAAGGG